MKLRRLVLQEMKHRRLNFTLGLLAVTAAVATLVGAQTLLTADELITRRLLDAKQQEVEQFVARKQEAVEQAGKELQDAIRKQMLGLGFNVLILPESQSLSELHLQGGLSATMPEDYVDRLASSKIMTVNHLLPSVTKRLRWEEHDCDIVVVGTRGEVPIQHRGLKKPLLDEVAAGRMVIGQELHRRLQLNVDDEVQLLGRKFTVSKVHDERGSLDDVTVWINLAEAQEMLGMQNLIHAILALECDCAGDRISQVRAEIAEILPGTQVIERYSQALTRAESRAQARRTAEQALLAAEQSGQEQLADEQKNRRALEQRHAGFAAVLVPLVIIGAFGLIALLSLSNSRQRRQEIGILRAIGFSTRQLLTLFLSKTLLMGIAGGILGALVGLFLGEKLSGGVPFPPAWRELLDSKALRTVVLTAPVGALALTCLAGWIPALMASRQDPATVLQSES